MDGNRSCPFYKRGGTGAKYFKAGQGYLINPQAIKTPTKLRW